MSNVIFCNGTFDLLHVGHFNFLNYCYSLKKEYKCELHVGLDSDSKICLDKGPNRPIFSYQERELALKSIMTTGKFSQISIIDYIHKFKDNQELECIIQYLNPKIMVKGEEWKNNVVGEKYCQSVRFYPTHLYNFSSSKIIETVLEMNNENFSMW